MASQWCAVGRRAWGTGLVWAALAGTAPSPLAAHHSLAMFDTTSRITLTGEVAVFEWTNPHAVIELDGAEDGGGRKRWTVELAGPGMLTRAGWKSSDIRHRDSLILIVNPLKSGDPGGLLVQATLADGRVLANGPASAP